MEEHAIDQPHQTNTEGTLNQFNDSNLIKELYIM